MTSGTWRDKLEQGYLYDAYQSYLQEAEQDSTILSNFDDLQRVRGNLRAKYWQKAFNIVQGDHEASDMVAWQALEPAIENLKKADDALEQRQPEQALSALAEVELELVSAEVATLRGTAYIFLNELAKAKASFEEALERDPRHFRAITNLGNLALEAGEIEQAIAYYEKALTIEADFDNALHNLGVAYRRQGKVAKSVRYLRKAQQSMRKADSEEARGRLSGRLKGQRLLRLQRYLWILVAVMLVAFFLLRR